MNIQQIKTQLARYQAADAHRLPDVLVFQRETPSSIEAFIYEPVLCLILQGSKISSIGDHFKAVTGTTPLQYQKDLRLIEAHALLTTMNHTVADAAFAVGYESPNQFSRDYSRKFGVAPSRVGRVGPPSHRP